MIVRRAHHEPCFTIVANKVIQDERVTDSLGLLIYLLSLPSDWEVRQAQLMTRFDCGRDRIQAWIRKLTALGYIRAEKVRDAATGAWLGSRYVVYEEPIAASEAMHGAHSIDLDEDLADEAESAENPRGDSANETAQSPGVTSPPQPENPVLRGEPENPEAGKPGSPIQRNKIYKYPPFIPPCLHPTPGDEEDLPPDLAASWRKFEALWPWTSTDNRERAKRRFIGLTDREREEALAGVVPYRRRCSEKQRPPQSAANWLRNRVWRDATGNIPDLVPVVEGTPAFVAWERYLRAIGKLARDQKLFATQITLANGTMRRGTLKPTLFPPAQPPPPPVESASKTEALSEADRQFLKHGSFL